MGKSFKIKEILCFLKLNGIDYNFIGDENHTIQGFSTLFNYKDDSLTFVSSLNDFNDYKHLFEDKKIKLIISSEKEEVYSCFLNVIQVDLPKRTFFSVLDNFFSNEKSSKEGAITSNETLYKRRSYISENAQIGKDVKIGIGCVIEDDVIIGDNTIIHHNVVIRHKTKIGTDCTILSGTIIGESGFNPLKKNEVSREMVKHYGGVTIKNRVHIGDNCSISCGAIEDTIINSGVKINKQVIIAHNVNVGKNTIFTAPAFVCGSVKIGENCHIAATTIRNQCKIGDNAVLGLGSVVVKDVPSDTTVIGNPAKPMNIEE